MGIFERASPRCVALAAMPLVTGGKKGGTMRRLVAVLVALSLVVPVLDAAAAPKQTKEEKAIAKAAKAEAKAIAKAAKSAAKAEAKAQKRVQGIEGKIAKEEAKHAKRMAKLTALRDKLEARGNIEAAANIQDSIDKENLRHDRVMARLQQALDDALAALAPEPEPDPEPVP